MSSETLYRWVDAGPGGPWVDTDDMRTVIANRDTFTAAASPSGIRTALLENLQKQWWLQEEALWLAGLLGEA